MDGGDDTNDVALERETGKSEGWVFAGALSFSCDGVSEGVCVYHRGWISWYE